MTYLSHLEYMAKTDTILPQFLKLRNETPELALKLLMDHYGDTMYGVTLRILDEKSLADDALQEGFVKIWKNLTEFNPEIASLFTWMLTIIRNTAIDVARKEKNRKIQMLSPGVYDSISHSEENQISDSGLMQQINKLEPKYKELIDLIYLKGFTQQEVSDQLELPLGTVKTRINTAIKMLRTALSTFMLIVLRFFE
ncbi:MAG: sigma-70 family RNA polymerase sigma factor [Saprospiraceae bacterium]|nr:sigma-70 family RNA polymerase sigma factor [Saprospiraceae bacterium]